MALYYRSANEAEYFLKDYSAFPKTLASQAAPMFLLQNPTKFVGYVAPHCQHTSEITTHLDTQTLLNI